MEPKQNKRSAYAMREDILAMHPPRVLLADDDPDCREPIAERLRALGYSVIEARNGSELAEQLDSLLLFGEAKGEDLPFALVISDVRMPGHTGLEVLDELRRASVDVGVILFSGDGRPQTREDAVRLGASAFLQKPFGLEELCDICRTLAPVVARSEAPKSWRAN